MTTVQEIFQYLEHIVPLSLAESYDNPGLLAGDDGRAVTRALIALDITREVCAEASETDAQLVISHHPVIFYPVKSVVKNGPTAALWELLRRDLAAICMHTNLDAAPGGVNDTLAQVLGLEKTGPLMVTGHINYKKITVFVPEAYAPAVRTAMADAGAGKLGDYDGCAFETAGTGYFRPLAGANAFIGETGKSEQVKEIRVEAICRAQDINAVIAAMKQAHPYEEPAYDIFEDEAITEQHAIGLTAALGADRELDTFARFVCDKLSAGSVGVSRASGTVRHIAICSGAWDDALTQLAKNKGADTILTGELKHSSMLLALSLGLNVVAAGHFATEDVICGRLADLLTGTFPDVSFAVAQADRNPAYYLSK